MPKSGSESGSVRVNKTKITLSIIYDEYDVVYVASERMYCMNKKNKTVFENKYLKQKYWYSATVWRNYWNVIKLKQFRHNREQYLGAQEMKTGWLICNHCEGGYL